MPKITNNPSSSLISKNFKKRPIAQLITMTLSLAGYGIVNNHAFAATSLDCVTTNTTTINTDVENSSTTCSPTNYIRVLNNGSLTNTTNGSLTNNEVLTIFSNGADGTSTLTNQGTLTNSGGLRNLGQYGGTSTLTNQGTLTNSSNMQNYSYYGTSTLTNAAGATLTNDGSLSNRSYEGGSSTLTNQGTLKNSGSILNSGIISNSGSFEITETGVLSNEYDGAKGSFIQTAGSTVVNGSMSGGTMDIQGGTLSGSGTIGVDTLTIGENATVNPGNSPGTLIVMGDMDMFGTLATEISSSASFDILQVQDTVSLSNTSSFDFLFDSGYTAVDGDSFDFLTASVFDFNLGLGFAFDIADMSNFVVSGLSTGFDWSVSFFDFTSDENQDSYLSLILSDNGTGGNPSNAVSAPATLALFALGLPLMGWLNRRRTKLAI